MTFPSCGKRRCVNVSIVNDDLISEPEEKFTISLSAVPVPPHLILVHPATGEVVITGDDSHPVIVLLTVTYIASLYPYR